jgi:hypothetical protein
MNIEYDGFIGFGFQGKNICVMFVFSIVSFMLFYRKYVCSKYCTRLKYTHLTMGNMVICNLNGTMIVTIDYILGLNRKSKFTQNLVDREFLCTFMNDGMILFFYSGQGDYLLFLA